MKIKVNTEKKTHIECILLGIVFLFFFCCYLYSDICATTASGVNLWNCILEGNFTNFYASEYSGVKGSYIPNGVGGGAYDLFLYVVFALYNFPLWVVEKVTGSSFLNFYFGRVYMKGLLLLFTVLTALIIKKVILLLTNNKKLSNWATFLFLVSELLVTTIAVIGGYDIIAVFFSTAGLYFYLKNEDKKFLLFFAMAIACKLFALWIFIPLLLLRRKNVLRIFADICLGLSIVIIPKILISTVSYGNGVIAHANIINNKIFCGNSGPISFGNIPLFFVATFVIWWICWKKAKVTQYEIIYYCTISMATFFLFSQTYPYWIVLLTPYIAMLIALNSHNIKDNILLESIFSFGYILYNACIVRHCFNLNLIVYMLKPARFPVSGEFDYVDYGFSSFMTKISTAIGIDIEHIASLFLTCFAVGLILFLIKNRPQQYTDNIGDTIDFRKYAWIRVLLSVLVAMLPFVGVIEYYF